MFGLSWEQIILILLAGLFLLGPERIPVATRWLMDSLRKMRSMAAGAQEQMRSQLGPEIEELRRQVADLQSLKEVSELRQLRDLNPRRIVGKSILGDQFSGGMSGFLGLNSNEKQAADAAGDSAAAASAGSGTAGGAGNTGGHEPADGASPVAASSTAAATPPTATELASRARAAGVGSPAPGTSAVWADGDST